jgi:hypothetical protein
MNTPSWESNLPSVGTTVRQLVKQCAEQARRELRATHPKYRNYGGDLGRFDPSSKKGQRYD